MYDIIRYCFRGKPLWASKDGTDPGVCSHCGGPRVYEMQLMPPLLYYLQQACKDLPSTSYSPNDWEWLTLVVFSCAQVTSCSFHQSHTHNHLTLCSRQFLSPATCSFSYILMFSTVSITSLTTCYMSVLFHKQSCTPAGSTHVDGKQWISVEEATILQYET